MRASDFIAETLISVSHGTNTDFDQLDVAKTSDGGIHFGSNQQAALRSTGKNSRIIDTQIDVRKPKRCKDDGSGWKNKIKSAKRSGYDSIVYLNRYENMTTERVEQLSQSGKLDTLDSLSDAAFKKLVPEAQDSYIVFDNDQIK